MKHTLIKRFDFCYGHRLIHYIGKCRHFHGHNAIVDIVMASDHLDPCGMVIDLAEVRDTIKQWIDTNLDHRMILHREDSSVPVLKNMGEPVFVMNENPSAENIAKLIFEQVKILGIPVTEVKFWETPTICAIYSDS